MRIRQDTTPNARRGTSPRLFALSCLAITFVAALVASGCDDDSFLDSGTDYNARSSSRHQAGPPQFWVPLRQPSVKTKSPELLAPTDSAEDKPPVIGDADALAAGDSGLVEKIPDPMAKLDTEDHVAGNFKYNKGYREPLLPSTTGGDGKELRDLQADGLSLESGEDTGSSDPRSSRIGTPAGPLGDLQRQRALRAKRVAAGQPENKPDNTAVTSDDEISAGLMHPDPVPDSTGPQ